jgi:hypothetical protein
LSWDRVLSNYANRDSQKIDGIPVSAELKNGIRFFRDNPEELKKFGTASQNSSEKNNLSYMVSFFDINAMPKTALQK